jgi:predicted dienelactone hydrolase
MKLTGFTILMLAFSSAWASGKTVTYQVDGADYEGYCVSPGGNAPLVLLIHDWDGLTDYEVKRANMLADMGYAVFAADLFGAGVRPTEVKDKRQHTGELYKDRAKMRALMNGALEQAAAMGGNRGNAVAMGYCFGGAAVLELARSGSDLKGFATFHGGLKTPDGQNYANTKGRLLIMQPPTRRSRWTSSRGSQTNSRPPAYGTRWSPTAAHRMRLPCSVRRVIARMPIKSRGTYSANSWAKSAVEVLLTSNLHRPG